MWTAVRTKDSHTKKSATTNHTPPLHRVFKNALLKTFKEFGVLRESHPSPCMALQETFLCSEVPHFNVFDFTVHWAHELVSGNTRNFKASLFKGKLHFLVLRTQRKLLITKNQQLHCLQSTGPRTLKLVKHRS